MITTPVPTMVCGWRCARANAITWAALVTRGSDTRKPSICPPDGTSLGAQRANWTWRWACAAEMIGGAAGAPTPPVTVCCSAGHARTAAPPSAASATNSAGLFRLSMIVRLLEGAPEGLRGRMRPGPRRPRRRSRDQIRAGPRCHLRPAICAEDLRVTLLGVLGVVERAVRAGEAVVPVVHVLKVHGATRGPVRLGAALVKRSP